MAGSEAVRQLVLRYFESWQEPSDFGEFRACLADEVVFDSNFGSMKGADALTAMVQSTESPWRDVTLMDANFTPDRGVIFYEGTDKSTGLCTRVAEFFKISEGLIQEITVVLGPKREIS